MDEKNRAVSYFRSAIFKTAIAVVLAALLFSACSAADERSENKERENETAERTVKDNVYLEGKNVGGMKESEVLEIIRDFAERTGGKQEITFLESNNKQDGNKTSMRKVNIEKTLEAVMNAAEGEKVSLVMETVVPNEPASKDTASKENTSKKAKTAGKEGDKQKKSKSKFKLIGKSTTPLLDKSESRLNNIYIASEKIDKTVVNPGEEFSFNAVVGKRTKAKGYEEAPIIIKTKNGPVKGYDIGGGICQISTTLYNAVEEAGLKVTERHEHSKDVGYVEKGEDATVSYGTADFKFVNTRKYPVVIRVRRGKKTITVELYEKRG